MPTIDLLETTGVPTTAAPTSLPTTPPPSSTGFGPVVPPEYTLGPTTTPFPTATPLPGTPSVTPVPTVTATPPPGLNPAMVGIQIHPRITQEEWRDMLYWANELGVGWIKVQFAWDEMESDGPGNQTEYWRMLELYMQQALGYGFQVMISVAKAPDWSRSTTEENGPATDPQLLADFVTHILSKFGPAIHAIEVWNEPNLRREWNGATMDGATYMRHFDAAYRAISAWSQENSHPITVVTAGLAPVGSVDGAVDDRTFLRQMYQAGLANYSNVAVGIHPYGWGNAPLSRCCNPVENRSWDDDPHFFFLETIEAYRQIMTQFGDTDAQLWVTEFGWATYDGFGAEPPQAFFSYTTEALQAQYTIEAIEVAQSSGSYDYIGPMILWNLNFAVIEGAINRGEEQAGYSLLRPDMSRRPAYAALHAAFH